MALSTFDQLWRQVLLRCPAASLFLARQWIDYSFRYLWDYKLWSWQIKQSQFLLFDSTNTGLVDATFGDQHIQGHGTTWTGDEVSRQFRVGTQSPIYTVTDVDVINQIITLSEPWGGKTQLSVVYTIYNAYVTPPQDFEKFITVWDPNYNWQLELNVTQIELNAWDAQRANRGTAYVVASRGFSDLFQTPAMPIYEIWPHQVSQYVFPYLYISRPDDLSDPGASLPRYVRGDILLEGALSQAARWPGAATDQRNPYFNLALAQQHDVRFRDMIVDIARTDDEIIEQDVAYMSTSAMPFASIPWGDARYLQSHDI